MYMRMRASYHACLPARLFWLLADWLQEKVRLDAILTVVDARHILQHLDDTQIQEGAENEVCYTHKHRLHVCRVTHMSHVHSV